ncbi:RimK/LysX family protein [Runella sp. SP2]|uniref:ATP-dependent zinc protease family protein n=1 Tax=Runella sp. SP2 TaxID=2268026 RepID=UPI000F073138|nr:RimK/LysX family protein [Runella sp. SP2]AYQ30880.1 ATP-dependent zinc protease [Runella sp. SP2]
MEVKKKKKPSATEKRVIGRNDMIDFPDLGLMNVRVKIDTGAYTSSIHCFKISVEEGVLSFFLPAHRSEKHQKFTTDQFELKAIKNSFGQTEMRYVIKTKVILFGKIIRTEFSLADRSQMRYPVLLGRKLLRSRFLVDVSLENLSYDFMQRKSRAKA